MRIQIGEHTEILHPGDTIYYNSSTPHGMIAVDGEDCAFYAIVLRNSAARADEHVESTAKPIKVTRQGEKKQRVYYN
jgi:acetyl-CoA synthetase